ncbi:DeoR/GlpR family DNA-binding transcription regulator [Parachitinimonas caeni]|uniref:DeoR/GlpR family DNA-binding transcription regulator n=1 Tax=Parachitinimonas caeni TaxID=3031301 RepID=A0ABT7E334_9NEIS|nr:DeoR/GlpR family DNA-binding transcription regulator [Parachitinimonas caeni]MDK2126737.1 DeoR/GlpR family DNA-binding transcription regulator [Parachitinimonas caeni]
MNPRQNELLELVRQRGFVSVDELASHFGVTMQTIRRDVAQLDEEKLVQRYHGGVGLPSSVQNIAYPQRQVLNIDAKRRIAELVARELPDGKSLFINLGTTTEEVAKALQHHRDLHVVTNNLNVAMTLTANPDCEVIVAGGVVRPRDRGVVGEATIDFIRQFRVDIGIIGISSIEPDGSLRDFDYKEVKVAQTIIEQSRQVWLVADQTKFNREAMVRLGHLSQVHCLFTDATPPEHLAAALREAGTKVFVADEETAA